MACGNLSLRIWTPSCGTQDLVPWWNLRALHWDCGVLATGPGGSSGKESTCQHRRYKRLGFNPSVGKIPPQKEMSPDSSILVWEIPWTAEPGWLRSMGAQRVRHKSAHTHTDPRSPGQSLILTDISFILSEILYVYFHLHSFSCTFSVFSICPHFFLLYPKMLLL